MKTKYTKISVHTSINVLLFYEYVKVEVSDYIKCVSEFINSDKFANIILSYITKYEHFLTCHLKTPINVVNIAKEYDSLTKNQDIITFLSSTNEYNYQFIIFRFIFESISKKPFTFNNKIYDINVYLEYLNYHFHNEHIILLNYSLNCNLIYILKAGGILKKYTNKLFDSLFPLELRKVGISKFTEILHSNNLKDENNIFDFVIEKPDDIEDGYIESFKMKYEIYPSLELNQFIIKGKYIESHENIIITTEYNQKSIIFSFSIGFYPLFGITPFIMQQLKSNGKVFYFNYLFNKINLKTDTVDSLFLQEKDNYILTYQKEKIKSRLTKYLDEGIELRESDIDTIKKMIENSPKDINQYFYASIKGEFISENQKYKIISFSNEKNRNLKKNNSNGYFNPIINKEENENFSSLLNYNEIIKSVTISSSSLSSIKENDKTQKPSKIIASFEQKGMNTINNFVKFISILCFLIILTCIIYLGVEIIKYQKFQYFFFIFQKYQNLKLLVEIQTLRLLPNLCIEIYNGMDCTNIFWYYSERYTEIFNAMKGLLFINEVIYYEF